MIYHIQGEHANHTLTEEVKKSLLESNTSATVTSCYLEF